MLTYEITIIFKSYFCISKLDMTKASSRALPYLTLAILVVILFLEAFADKQIDLETYMPLLIALGIGGAAKSAIERAAKAKSAMPEELSSALKTEMAKLKPYITNSTQQDDPFEEIKKELPVNVPN